MKNKVTPQVLSSITSLMMLIMLCTPFISQGQDSLYNPKGFDDKWNFSVTPFLLLPTVSGEVHTQFLSKEYGISTSKFTETLNGTLMMNGEAWKGSFFLAPSYIYNHNEIDKNLWTSPGENVTFNVNPVYKRHIAELMGGWRIKVANPLVFDSYIGLRYTHYTINGTFSLNERQQSFSEKTQFWDPVIGVKLHYYPHPRIPIELRGDVGGFGISSELTWSSFLNAGYSATQWLDVLVGFGALGNSYKTTTDIDKDLKLSSVTYGFNFGLRFYITGREKDPTIFKK